MESPLSTATSGPLNVQRCMENFSSDLAARFDSHQAVPPSAVGVRRFTARQTATTQPCFISLRQYGQPLNTSQIDFQRAIAARISRTESLHLCGLVESRIEPEAHYVVSQLGEALEDATLARWPRAMLDTHAIFLPVTSPDTVPPVKLIVPPLPGPEIAHGAACFPVCSNEYVLDLALLSCELLGMPARRQRFRPLPHLSADTNHLLRDIIECGSAGTFESARHFAAAFIAAGASPVPGTTAVISMATLTMARTTSPTATAEPIPCTTTGAQQAPTVPVTALPSQTARKRPPLPVPAQPEKPLCSHLRLVSTTSPHLPQVGVCVADEVRIGRSATAHFVSQFFPRNPRNDERTRMLSREHVTLRREGANISLSDLSGTNQSFINGKPVESDVSLRRSCRLTIAGEYDLDIRRLDSWWAEGEVWENPAEKPPLVIGALSLAPTLGVPALDYRLLWLFSDAAFGINSSGGAINPQPLTIQATLGWFVRAHNGIWVVASEDDGSLTVDNVALKAGVPAPLHHDTLLRIGPQEWRVQSLAAA
ncbi:MAG: hypothetical protein B7Z37_21390 [Verrucomicrobia bacterium 12-59-8]|nr:MAG: hypothetical protein B7Z37_21390 [Verrucomicrobia bacterium 12-59-8]